MTILFLADLHINEEGLDVCSVVLSEFTAAAAEEKADLVILGGDIFDSAENLRLYWSWFWERMDGLPLSVETVYISGNHDLVPADSMRLFSVPSRCLVHTKPEPAFLELAGAELVLLPHSSAGTVRPTLSLPEKRNPRFLVTHGIVEGHSLAELDRSAMIIPAEIPVHWGVDAVLAGHLHKPEEHILPGGGRVCYPGSSRIWRKGETGSRGFCIVKTEPELRIYRHPLRMAGNFIRQSVMLIPGEKPLMSNPGSSPGGNDWLHIDFFGAVGKAEDLEPLRRALGKWWKPRVRKLSFGSDEVLVLAESDRARVIRRFLARWKEARPSSGGADFEVWKEAGLLGLEKIASGGVS